MERCVRRGSGRRSLEDEIEQRGSSDSDFRVLGRSFARWKTKSLSRDSDDGAIARKEKRRG